MFKVYVIDRAGRENLYLVAKSKDTEPRWKSARTSCQDKAAVEAERWAEELNASELARLSGRKVPRATVTYFIEDEDGNIKIGKSSPRRVESRRNALQTGTVKKLRLLAAIKGDHEARLHEKFSHLRLTGEWFSPAPEIHAEIRRAARRESKRLYGQIKREHGIMTAGEILGADPPDHWSIFMPCDSP